MKDTPLTGLVLAGGAGRRAGGRDKGLLTWQGKPLIEHVVAAISPQVETLLISCNRNQDKYSRYTSALVTDRRPGFQGPLAGLEAAAPRVATDFLVVVACDLPQLPPNLTATLLDGLSMAPGAGMAYAVADGRRHYLCAAVRTNRLASLSEFLDTGGRAVRDWYQQQHAIGVEFPGGDDAFRNVNSPGQS